MGFIEIVQILPGNRSTSIGNPLGGHTARCPRVSSSRVMRRATSLVSSMLWWNSPLATERAGAVHLVVRMLGRDGEDFSFVNLKGEMTEVEAWIESEIGLDYLWPGNVRELEQCVRNVLVRGSYRPLQLGKSKGTAIEPW